MKLIWLLLIIFSTSATDPHRMSLSCPVMRKKVPSRNSTTYKNEEKKFILLNKNRKRNCGEKIGDCFEYRRHAAFVAGAFFFYQVSKCFIYDECCREDKVLLWLQGKNESSYPLCHNNTDKLTAHQKAVRGI